MPTSQSWINSFPGLLWSIHVPHSRLSVVKNWEHHLLREKTVLLLKDAFFRQQVVLAEDVYQLNEFWDAIAVRKEAYVFFRLAQDKTRWLLLQGWPDPADSSLYMGSLQRSHRPYIDNTDPYSPLMYSIAGYPVLLCDMTKQTVIAANQASRELFDMQPNHPLISVFSQPDKLAQAFAEARARSVWSGALSVRLAKGKPTSLDVRITYAPWKKKQLARLSVIRHQAQEPTAEAESEKSSLPHSLLEQVQGKDLRSSLKILLRSHTPHPFDGILFSRIASEEGRVSVFGVGKPWQHVWGESFAYDGTIAQHIERHKLDALLVHDTHDSVKSIDWALFVPRGVRSYYGMPYFADGKLQAVLILCSCRPCAFSETAPYYLLYPAFEHIACHC